ncbi:MAG: ATP synthase F1 subunit gamma [Eubacterium sp.]|nr:ATP synthase F1 subunit gamma [Eubacterium sp.]
MASMRDIKRRRSSIQSTSQITKAMKLVSTVKLQHAKGRAQETKPYFDKMYETVSNMLAKSRNIDHPLITDRADKPNKKKGVILISSNRGLAGGYNSNIVKLVTQGDFSPEDTIIYPIGTKGMDAVKRQGYTCVGDYSEVMNSPMFGDAISIGKTVISDFEQGEIDEIYLAYTVFKNTVVHIPTLIKLLPFSQEDMDKMVSDGESAADNLIMNYEPEETETLGIIIPMYINSLIFGALVEAVASENGARMQAMDSATTNAEEMIDKLGLQYNRARQSAITQELTEIVAGASAIE